MGEADWEYNNAHIPKAEGSVFLPEFAVNLSDQGDFIPWGSRVSNHVYVLLQLSFPLAFETLVPHLDPDRSPRGLR